MSASQGRAKEPVKDRMKGTDILNSALMLVGALVCSGAWAQVTVSGIVTDAYDGDTLTVEAGTWPGFTWTGGVRVRGIDTPEIRGECESESDLAIVVRDHVRDLLLDESILMCGVSEDKYGGRVLGWVFYKDEFGEVQSLADDLLQLNYAQEYDGGTKPGWCGEAVSNTPRAEALASAGDVCMQFIIAETGDDDLDESDPNHPLNLYDDNGNGRISCSEARAHGIAPVYRGHPAYPYMTDRDGDGVVCE